MFHAARDLPVPYFHHTYYLFVNWETYLDICKVVHSCLYLVFSSAVLFLLVVFATCFVSVKGYVSMYSSGFNLERRDY